jgi:hypothetical protein
VEWLWSHTKCVGNICYADDDSYVRAQAEWLWMSIKPDHPDDLPVKESLRTDCRCGPDCGCGHGGNCQCTQADCYEKLRARAIKENKPLVVGVGCEPPRVSGCLAMRYDDLAGFLKPSIVVARPQGKELFQAGVLSTKASDLPGRIKEMAFPKPVMSGSIVVDR